MVVYLRAGGSGGGGLWLDFTSTAMRLYDDASSTQLGYSSSYGSTQNVWYDVHVKVDGSNVQVWRGASGGAMDKVFDVSTASTTTTGRLEFRALNGKMLIDNVQILADGLSSTSTFAYDAANELTSMTGPDGSTSFGYDTWGRQTSKSRGSFSTTYAYRYDQKLYSVTSDFPDEGNVSYDYGADGKRRERTAGTDVTKYKWDESYTVLSEEDSSGALTRAYVGGNMAHYGSGTTNYRYYLTDDYVQSTRALYDDSGNLAGSYDYTPYGDTLASQKFGATSHLYGDLDWDTEANLYFAPYRYYNPDSARWLTRDPLDMVNGPNVYDYVSAMPITHMDSLGLVDASRLAECLFHTIKCDWESLDIKTCAACGVECVFWGGWPPHCEDIHKVAPHLWNLIPWRKWWNVIKKLPKKIPDIPIPPFEIPFPVTINPCLFWPPPCPYEQHPSCPLVA